MKHSALALEECVLIARNVAAAWCAQAIFAALTVVVEGLYVFLIRIVVRVSAQVGYAAVETDFIQIFWTWQYHHMMS